MGSETATDSARRAIVPKIVVWCLDGMKTVCDRLEGVIQEMERETNPKQEHAVYLHTINQLVSDIPLRYPQELFYGGKLPRQWKELGSVATKVSQELDEQFCRLAEMTADDDELTYRGQFSLRLVPQTRAVGSASQFLRY